MKRDVLAEVGLHRVAVLAGEHGPGPEVDCAGGAGHEAGCEDGGEGEEGGWPGHDIVEDTGGGASAAEATSDNTELRLITVHAAGRARATAPHSPHSPAVKVSAKFRGTQYSENKNKKIRFLNSIVSSYKNCSSFKLPSPNVDKITSKVI